MGTLQVQRPPFTISNDPTRLDVDVIHGFLTRSYWAEGIQKPRIQRLIQHSYCYGLYVDDEGGSRQIGFARVLSDLSAIAYLMDVFVLEAWRGKGLGKWLVENVLDDPTFIPVRRWILATEDAHSLYTRFGFTPLQNPEHYLHKYDPDKYRTDSPEA